MGIHIESAGTKSYGAIVNSDGRMLVEAASVDGLASSSRDGDGFCISTDFITVNAAAGYSGVFFLRNNSGSKKLHISHVCTSNMNLTKWHMIKNPTTGTLLDDGLIKEPENLSFNSGNRFDGIFTYGDGSALTVTDGVKIPSWINPPGGSTNALGGSMVLGTNNSLAIMCEPTVIDTDVSITLLCYYTSLTED